jgi:hypothetical protein
LFQNPVLLTTFRVLWGQRSRFATGAQAQEQ